MKPFQLYRQFFIGALLLSICVGFCPSASLQSARVGQSLNFAIPVSALIKLLRFGVEEARGSTAANKSDVRIGGHTNAGASLDPDPIIAKGIKNEQEYVRSSSGSAESYYRLAETYRRWYHKVEAIQLYKRTIELKPSYAEAQLC